jgi:uncharacterized membrane protein (DUF4010 family)
VGQLDVALNLAVAALSGLAVGFEREWSGHASGPRARFAGVRTFFLLGAIGGIAGWLAGDGVVVLAAVLLAAIGALVVVAYLVAARRSPEEVEGTTEVAAVLVLGIGVLAGLGFRPLASGLTAVTVLILGEKHAIRGFVARIEPTEMRAALQFAVLALVVLPLLPEGPFGPFDAIRPRMIWTVVLLFSALNFAGYLIRKALGEVRGYLVTGALGGLISSTALTLTFARLSRRQPEHATALAAGVVAACTVLVPRVAAITAALNPGFLPRVALGLSPMLVIGAIATLLGNRWRADHETEATEPPRNPLELGQAIRMAVAFQAILLVIGFAQAEFGGQGVLAAAVLAGLTDVDALTLSMARVATDPANSVTAARGLVAGVIANTVLKTGLGLGLGSAPFVRQLLPRMIALMIAGGIGFLMVSRSPT